ncbi:DUF374 domain-containing protein [Rhodobacterales bacterium HKCCE3408]|nr:DUF374 domain-containing protein [Rhodobacterales bacterium HKCCE3408]
MTKPRTLRRRIADWPPLHEAAGRFLAGWLRLVRLTSRWSEDGYGAVEAAVAEHGAVILVFWHQRTFATPYVFDTAKAPGRSLNADTRPGSIARAMLHRFGYSTTRFPKQGGMAVMREVLTGLKQGVSIGIAVDGPSGPERVVKPFAVQWARASGKPVFVFGFSARSYWSWPTWDRLMFPKPFTRIALVWRPWEAEVPRRLSDQEAAELSADLGRALDAVTAEADHQAGRG